MGLFDLFSRKKEKQETLDKGLEKTQRGFFDRISHAIAGKSTVDDDVLDNLEEVFVTSDVGVDTTLRIIERLQARVARDKYVGASELNRLLCEEISEMLARQPPPCNYGGGCQRCRQDHYHRQDGRTVQACRQQGDARRGRHLPCRRHRAARGVGTSRRRARGEAEDRCRPGFSGL